MPNYATTTQLTDRFEDSEAVAHLTDNPGGDPDTDVLTEVLETAESEINSYLAKRYLVPVDTTADSGLAQVLKGKTLDLAQHYLLSRGDLVTEAKAAVRDNVIQWCRDVSRGVIVLPAACTPSSTAARSPTVDYGFGDAASTSSRVFTRDSQENL